MSETLEKLEGDRLRVTFSPVAIIIARSEVLIDLAETQVRISRLESSLAEEQAKEVKLVNYLLKLDVRAI